MCYLLNDSGDAHKKEIDPYVTIWHWDTPQALEAEYGGFLSRNIVKDYEDYCDLLFKEYGSKVKKWITLNEPMGTTGKAYDEGVFAPGHCSPWVNRACRVGDSGIEPYIVAHNLLLAHSAAYHLYKSKYQHLTAEIGVTYVTHWFVPYSNATKDVDAAKRALDWMYGWFMDPITFGNYPRTMVDLLGSRLPKFTEEESRLLRNSFDFLGLNYYTAYYVKHNDDFDEFHLRYATDSHGITTGEKDGIPIGPHLGSYWQYFYPEGLRVLLEYTKETYMDPVIYITENGLSEKDNATQTLAEALRDDSRIDFYNSHLTNVLTAMKEKQVNVKGYFAWSYTDNFEWNEGYTVRFGLNYVNYTDLSRHPKHSACWKDYEDYCDLLFKEYGSKVKKWITLNEPMGTTGKAYDEGVFAPGHCSPWVNRACRVGDSGIKPYIVAHNLLLAHSAAYHLYKSKYQHLTAEIGVTYVTHWFVPYSNATKDVDAAQRALDWMYGWFMDPITFGNYPRTMVDLLGSRLPKFTEEESRLLRKSFDFLGLNYYTAYYVKHNDDFDEFHLRYATDSHGITTGEKDGIPIGPHLGSYWQYFYPEGLRVLLEYTKETYMDPVIYITENGLSEKDNATQTLAEALRDDSRIDFYNSHLTNVLTAIKEKQVNVKGYFAWSYADNFEWNEGYTVRFGLNYVNYTDLSRHPKHSACWKDYEDYCDLLFKEYGSKVKKWITLNEPMGTTGKAYDEGVFAPGHCSPWVNRACRVGDSGIEPYIVAHNLLLAHSAAYHLYKNKYQHLTAEIGVTYVTHWFVPYSNATKDVDAAQRALDWMYGWFMDPITFGNYPRTMVDLLGSRLPKFTEEESRLLRKSFDFLGLNYYTAYYVKHNDDFDEFHLRYATDSHGITTGEQDGILIGPHLGSYWQYFYPEGLRVLLEYTKETYMDPVIYITENGLSEKDNATQTLAEALRDDSRIDFYNSHLTSVLTAMKEKQVNVKGYFAWSYADNFEWNEGYTVRFGLNYVNYTDLSRHPKHSAC
ncbi:Beta-glucosidase 12 [Linum perenne]